MAEPIWLTLDDIDWLVKVVGEQYPEHFIQPYPHKRNDLAAGVNRPQEKWRYGEEEDMTVLAAEYAYGVGKAHAFADGNKRICFLAAIVFLERNFVRLVEPEPGFFAQPIIDLMADRITTKQLARLLAAHGEWIDTDAE